MSWILTLLFSLVIDVGAVVYTRSVQKSKLLLGMFVTGTLAALNWAVLLMVVKQDDGLVIPSIVGHVAGFAIGMMIPVKDQEHGVCQRCHPTTEQAPQSSDPS